MNKFNWKTKEIRLKNKRSPFGLQKGSFWKVKGLLLKSKRIPFERQKDPFWKTLFFHLKSYRIFPFSLFSFHLKSKWVSSALRALYYDSSKLKRKGGKSQALSAVICRLDISVVNPYSPRLIASWGHTLAHVPHSVQRSGLIEYFSPSEIASTGHSPIHVPHAMQSSPIT